eukprot:4804102-Prorocentrum_lima.AAC.1
MPEKATKSLRLQQQFLRHPPRPSFPNRKPTNPTGLQPNEDIEKNESIYYAYCGDLSAKYENMFT